MGNIIKCQECHGQGYEVFVYQTGSDDYDEDYMPCDLCRGAGSHNLLTRFWKCLSNDWTAAHIWEKRAFKTYDGEF